MDLSLNLKKGAQIHELYMNVTLRNIYHLRQGFHIWCFIADRGIGNKGKISAQCLQNHAY